MPCALSERATRPRSAFSRDSAKIGRGTPVAFVSLACRGAHSGSQTKRKENPRQAVAASGPGCRSDSSQAALLRGVVDDHDAVSRVGSGWPSGVALRSTPCRPPPPTGSLERDRRFASRAALSRRRVQLTRHTLSPSAGVSARRRPLSFYRTSRAIPPPPQRFNRPCQQS